MSSRRTMVLIAAIAMGALAAFVLRNYINDQEQKANPNPVKVWVVTREIKRGEAFTSAEGMGLKQSDMPKTYVPETKVDDVKSLTNKVASTNLAPNQVLVEGMFVTTDKADTGLRDRLKDGHVAIAVPIEGVRAVGGLLQPGDFVNIMVAPKPKEESSDAAATPTTPATGGAAAAAGAIDPKQSPFNSGARYLYQQVRIVSIGTSVAPLSGQVAAASTSPTSESTLSTSGGVIVFEVPASAAQIIASIDPSTLYLTLLKPNYNLSPLTALAPELVKSGGNLPGETDGQLTPYGPKGYASVTTTTAAPPTTTKGN